MANLFTVRVARPVAVTVLAGLIFTSALGDARGQSSTSEAWRKQAPGATATKPLRLPAVRRIRLQNGLSVVTVEDHRAPIVTISIAIPVGSVNDPAGSAGIAAATAELLTAGAGARTSRDITDEIERLGGQMTAVAHPDYTEITASVLTENRDRFLAIAALVTLHPDFPADEVALYKDNRAQTVVLDHQDPSYVAHEYFNRAVYGGYPYAVLSPTAESIASLSRASIQQFHKEHYIPEGSVIVLVGDFDPSAMESQVKSVFEGWKAQARHADSVVSLAPTGGQRIYLIDRPGSEQADIRIGNLSAKRSAADFIPLIIANTVLGGGTSSRLFLNVREEKGYAYDVASSLDALRDFGAFYSQTETRNEVAAPAIREILAEFNRLRKEKISEDDLRHAKNFIDGTFALALSTQAGVASRLVYASIYGLGADFLETFRDRVDAVTIDEVQRAAQNYILPEQATIVVVGDASNLKKSLGALGRVQVIEPAQAAPSAGSGKNQ